jgi:hypothetical protein
LNKKKTIDAKYQLHGHTLESVTSAKYMRILRVKKRGFKKMGMNKNISISMLFDCVRVNTGLGFH